LALESLSCKECGATYPLEARFVCEQCFGPLEARYDFSSLDAAEARRKISAGSRGIWRYSDFLPFDGRPGDPLEPGLTPLVRADRLADRLGIGELWIKNDAANPTHSFKDRVVAVAVAKAKELGFATVACASTGNLANAVAAHAAAGGFDLSVSFPA
jgi:threonine synthase